MTWIRLIAGFLAAATLTGCSQPGPTPAPEESPADEYGGYGYSQDIRFLDTAPANATDVAGLSDLSFTETSGEATRVRDLAGPNGAVVVVTRGNTNPICPFCSTQTAHYIRDYAEFSRRGVEVLLVYPVELRSDTARLDAFLTDARGRLGDPQRKVPFPVLFDVELHAVDQLGIRKDLSKPATYIVDAAGDVRYGYVGAHWGDRPTTTAVLGELDRLGIGSTPSDYPDAPAVAPPPTQPATVPDESRP